MDYSEKDVIDNLLKTTRDLFTALRYFVLDEANISNRDMTPFFFQAVRDSDSRPSDRVKSTVQEFSYSSFIRS